MGKTTSVSIVMPVWNQAGTFRVTVVLLLDMARNERICVVIMVGGNYFSF